MMCMDRFLINKHAHLVLEYPDYPCDEVVRDKFTLTRLVREVGHVAVHHGKVWEALGRIILAQLHLVADSHAENLALQVSKADASGCDLLVLRDGEDAAGVWVRDVVWIACLSSWLHGRNMHA